MLDDGSNIRPMQRRMGGLSPACYRKGGGEVEAMNAKEEERRSGLATEIFLGELVPLLEN